MRNKKDNTDVFIKDEGYADFRFWSDKAKQTAHDLGFPNSLKEFGNSFCGQPVWNNKSKKGMYQCGIDTKYVHKYAKELRNAGLIVESEYE